MTIAAVTPLAQSVDVDALLAGFALGLVVMCVAWVALIGVSILRRMLSD